MKITKAVCGEYLTGYITDEQRVCINKWVAGYSAVQCVDVGLSNIIDGIGGQYDIMVLDNKGVATVMYVDKELTINKITSPVSNVSKIFNSFGSYFCYSNGVMYQWGANLWNIGTSNTKAVALTMPTGKVFTKFTGSCSTGLADLTLYGLATDGTVWKWTGKTPSQVTFPGNIARDITTCGHFAIVVETASDLFAWGGYNPEILGISWNQKTPVSIKKQFTDAGAVFPTKQIIGNYSSLHIIDANDNHFAIGNQIIGEVGYGPMKDWVKGNKTYAWDWSEKMLQPVRQITGKWKELFTSPTITFYYYGLKTNGNLFAWGRNKSLSLGNGLTLPSFGGKGYDTYPNALDIPTPTYVDPLNKVWTIIKDFNPNNPPAPTIVPEPVVTVPVVKINAGSDIETTAKKLKLSGTVDGSYKSVKWTFVKTPLGAALFSLNSDETLQPELITMVTGEFIVRMTVTLNDNSTLVDDCKIVVKQGVWTPPPAPKEIVTIALGSKVWTLFDNGQYNGERVTGSFKSPEVEYVFNNNGTWIKK